MERSNDDTYLLTAPGKEAVTVWRRLRALVEETGRYPVILGSDEDLERHVENLELYDLELCEEESEGSSLGEILHAAQGFDAVLWMQQRTRGGLESVMGDWPAGRAPPALGDESFTVHRDVLTREPFEGVHIALVSTRSGWEVPAHLRFGGFNACPQPHEHVALWHRWHDLYGAELVGISHDVVEALVSRPPNDREGGAQLAREQYAYCSDIVSQGCGTICELAALLINRSTWYFWWD